MKSANIFKNINEQPKVGLLIRSKKRKNSEEFLMKKKTKISNVLTDQLLEKVQFISKIIGKEKYIYFILKVKFIFINFY